VLGPGKPSVVFVSDMAELFLDGRSTPIIDRVVGTMFVADHIAIFCTKRAEQMAEYFAALSARTLCHRQSKTWLGFSAERQQEFDGRWAAMRKLAARGWTVFVSIAPMLQPVRLPPEFLALARWAIVSGEQGPHRRCRDMHPNWARAVRDQCADAGMPFFLKQMARKDPIPPDLMITEFPLPT
jgi:protein gp37